MNRLILLNGPPGVGKSTVATRFAAEHPGTLRCDIDVLRTMIGGWEDDYERAGGLIRPAALGLIASYLRKSGDVVHGHGATGILRCFHQFVDSCKVGAPPTGASSS